MEKGPNFNNRIKFISVIFLLSATIYLGRLFQLQILEGKHYRDQAKLLSDFKEIIVPNRGEILAQNNDSFGLLPLASNKKIYNAILSTYGMTEEEKEKLINDIKTIFSLPEEEIIKKISIKNDPYIKLKENITPQELEKVRALKSKNLTIENDWQRYYPLKEVTAKNIGFYGYAQDKRVGRYGLEQKYEDILKGVEGFISGQKDALGRIVPIVPYEQKGGIDGSSLITSIDTNVATKAYETAKELVDRWQAQRALVVISNPADGTILASEEYPSYNPNEYHLVSNQSLYLNGLAQTSFEPGSIFKPITMAIALEKGLIEPESTYNDTGEVKIGKYTIKNSTLKAYGKQTMTQVLEKSLNTGAVFVQKLIGNAEFKKFVEKFGFGAKTDIDIAGEIVGDLKNLDGNIEVNFSTASYGQGISVTPAQIIQALSAIANGGYLIKPHFVKKIRDSDGKELEILIEKKRVISEETSKKLTQMLVEVTRQGSGRQAKIYGYDIATKTGTAQIPLPDKKGYSDETIHSAIFFGPVPNPRFFILIKLDKPQGVRFSETSVVPAGGKLMKFLFDYYQIPPLGDNSSQ